MGRDGRGGNPFLVMVPHRCSTDPPGGPLEGVLGGPGGVLGGGVDEIRKKNFKNDEICKF